jgi:hypothetical protein
MKRRRGMPAFAPPCVPSKTAKRSLYWCRRTGRRQLLLGSAAGALSSCCLPGMALSFVGSSTAEAGICAAASSPIDIALTAEQPVGSSLPPIKLKYPRFVKGTVITTGDGTPQVWGVVGRPFKGRCLATGCFTREGANPFSECQQARAACLLYGKRASELRAGCTECR